MSGPLDAGYESLLRELAPQVLGAVMRRFHDFAGAEDAVQEALIAAAVQWPSEGIPENPCGWLIQVACRRMTDHVRSEIARRRRETIVATESQHVAPEVQIRDGTEQDDTLSLLFMCCHPALTPPSAIALTLRAVAGLTNAEIAHAFLVPETTMAQRISRAKKTIKASDVPFRSPMNQERAERLPAVLHVLYLIFNEGYTSSIGPQLQRPKLAREAIRLARSVHTLLCDDTEVAGLLALMLLTDARRAARTGPDGDLIPLTTQDRTRWDQSEIAEGVALLTATLAKGSIGPYQIQAAIAAVHDEAARYEDTDWPQILVLYELFERFSDNPVVTLNRAVAAAMVHGPSAGLKLLDVLDADGRLKGNYRLDAVRAHLLEMAGRHEAAITHYRTAASRTTSLPERNYLFTQAARLAESAMAVLVAAVTQEKAHREKLSRELEIAREVQQRLFPQELPAIPGIECYGTCRPALVVGGDYYDFLSLADRLGVAIGDVAGKGISAALLMASLQGSLRAEALRAEDDVGEMIAKVNRLLCHTTTANRYATLFYAQFDATTNALTYVNAGHNAPLVFKQSNGSGEIVRLDAGGTVVGLSRQFTYEQARIQLDSGDLLVGFTDGITEARNAAEEEWGEENLIRTIQSCRGLTAKETVTRIMQTVDAFAAGSEQHDDMTIVALRIL